MKKLYFSLLTLLLCFVANAQIVNIPDANFKAKLLAASPSLTTASVETPIYNSSSNSWTVSSYNKIDTNNDGEIQVSEAQTIKYLNISFSSITNIEGMLSFTNIIYLGCVSNPLTSLNVQGLTNLQGLICSNNQLTSLNFQGLTNLLTLDCSNNPLTSLNVQGLTNLETLFCITSQLSSLNVQGLTNLQFLDCSDNQLSSINVQGLANLQFLICKNNALSSLNVQGLTNLITLTCYNNQITTLNLQGLTNLLTLDCFNNQLPSLNVQELGNLHYLDCSNNQLTSLFVKNGNLQGWSFFAISENPNLAYICADEADLTFVQTKVNQAGYTATCQVNSYCSFVPGGTYYTIQGNNKLDTNSNGCDAIDGFYPNLKFTISNGTVVGSLISNASGNFSIPVSAGTHTITPQFENPNYFTSSPTSTTINFPATASPFVQDFCIAPNGIHHDLEVVIIPLEPARPGFDATYKIKYKNKGNQNETATLVFNYNDAILDYISSTLTPTTTSTGSLSWNIGTVTPFQSGEFVVTLNVNSPMETPAVNAGDILNYTAVINGLNTDETPVDNTATLNQTVVNSYDPNDKTCLEGTTINPNMIGQYVHYQIRFENTGTFPAENIVVKDMIDTTKFDIATLQITDASHSCVTRITNPNKVEFIFEDINLPFDDATNDGYVVFKIKTKSTLVVGNTISNLANIYFDYNFPIVTNTATSTFQALATNEFDSNNALTLYPIPVKGNLNFSLKNNEITSSISIYNLLGQLIQTTTNPSNSIDVSNLQSGSYLIKVTTDKGINSGKFVKE